MRKVIIINGLIASGKSTIGKELVASLNSTGNSAVYMDIDNEVTRLNPSWVWSSSQKKHDSWVAARKNCAEHVNTALKTHEDVVVSGPFFLYAELTNFIKYLDETTHIYLFTLQTSLDKRLDRNQLRENKTQQDVIKSQFELWGKIKEHYGCDIENKGEPCQVVKDIITLMESSNGLITQENFS